MKKRLPPWIRIRFKADGQYGLVQTTLRRQGLHTVCESAHCPNRQECFNLGTATVMILGNICTRNCLFCAVQTGVPKPVDPDEPRRVAELVKSLNLRHAVITSVTRDDLPDGGASAFAATVNAIRALTNNTVSTEVLTPDFNGSQTALALVLVSGPDVFNHNLETVERLQPVVRPQADYRRSLRVLQSASAFKGRQVVKSGLMAGMGETDDELFQAMSDLLGAGCQCLTIGQYLAPSRRHLPVHRFVPPEMFNEYRQQALSMGFNEVAAGPLVRSSYLADRFFQLASSKQAEQNSCPDRQHQTQHIFVQ